MKMKNQFSLLELLGIVTAAAIFAFLWSLPDLDGGVRLIASTCLATFAITYLFRCSAMVGISVGVAVWNGIITVHSIMDGYNASQIVAGLLFLMPGFVLFGIVPIIVSWWIAWNLSQRNNRPGSASEEGNQRQ